MKKENTKIKNPNIKKHGIFTVVFTVILVALIVLANILATSIAQKAPTTIDVTADESNSLTLDNIDFIKSVDKPVEIVVCATREGYTGSEMVSYVYSVYQVQENATPDNYFNQTVTLLESYPKYNDNISVTYVDPQSPKFKKFESDYDVDITYGDILVRCTRPDENGKETTFKSVLTFEDIYELYDASSGTGGSMYGYTTYTITSSNIESKVSSAIFTVAASGKKKIAVLSTHATKNAEKTLTTALEEYNFEILDLDGIISEKTLADVDTALLVAPVSDLSENELGVLDNFLDNNGERGKNLIVFGSTASPATPNLNEFLEEWGIKVEDAMAYDTNPGYRLSDGNSMMLFNKKDDLTGSINAGELSYYCGDNVAVSRAYETSGTRTTHILMSTSAYAVAAPKGVSGYTASSNDTVGEMPVILATEDTTYDDNYDEVSSYVAYFASADFIDDTWEQFGDNGNMEFAVTVTNMINGRDAASMYFLPKTTGVYTMSTPFSDAQYTVVYIVSIFVIPALLLIGGVLVWIRRRNR